MLYAVLWELTLTRAAEGKASYTRLATQWLAKIMHSATVSWISRG